MLRKMRPAGDRVSRRSRRRGLKASNHSEIEVGYDQRDLLLEMIDLGMEIGVGVFDAALRAQGLQPVEIGPQRVGLVGEIVPGEGIVADRFEIRADRTAVGVVIPDALAGCVASGCITVRREGESAIAALTRRSMVGVAAIPCGVKIARRVARRLFALGLVRPCFDVRRLVGIGRGSRRAFRGFGRVRGTCVRRRGRNRRVLSRLR
jgi:hypothetical protein